MRTLVSLTLNGMSGIAGVVLLIATPFLPSTYGKEEVAALAVFCLMTSTYLSWREERLRANDLADRVASQGRLVIEFRPHEQPFEHERQGLYSIVNRVFSIRVRNVGGSTVSRCRVWMMSCEPFDGHPVHEIRIPRPEEDLHPGDAFLLKLASFKESGTDKADNTMGELHVPFLSGSPEVGERTIGREHQYIVAIRATGDGSEPCDATFNIWLSLTPRLHVTMVAEGASLMVDGIANC